MQVSYLFHTFEWRYLRSIDTPELQVENHTLLRNGVQSVESGGASGRSLQAGKRSGGSSEDCSDGYEIVPRRTSLYNSPPQTRKYFKPPHNFKPPVVRAHLYVAKTVSQVCVYAVIEVDFRSLGWRRAMCTVVVPKWSWSPGTSLVDIARQTKLASR